VKRLLFTVVALSLLIIALPIFAKLTYSGQAPIASFTYSPIAPTPYETITFDASTSYDPDGSIVKYTWDFGDGTVATVSEPVINYSYPIDGNFTVELTVTDSSGSTGKAVAVIQVKTVIFFRVCFLGSITPLANVTVTAYYNNGTAWVKAPASNKGIEIKYDNMTQPDLADNDAERFRNPGYTASILRKDASNIGFDAHPSTWTVFFKFQWGSKTAYWPNCTDTVYTYSKYEGVEVHYYRSCHQAYWDDSAGTYVIKVGDIPGSGVSASENHPIVVGIFSPPPPTTYYLNVKTDPTAITTIPGQGGYAPNTNVTLAAPTYVSVSTNTRYRFNYWDVDGTSQGSGVNPITAFMNGNHTATAHYKMQYTAVFNYAGLSSDSTGTVVTVDGSGKTFADFPYTYWADNGSSVTYSYSSTVSSLTSGKRYRLSSVSGPSSPITVTGPTTVVGNYAIQYLIAFTQTGLDSTATGMVVTVNDSVKTYSQLPYTWWVDSGSLVAYSYSSVVSSTATDTQFSLVRVECPSSQFVATGPVTINGVYCKQYKVVFKQTGLDSTATGTVVTVTGTSKTYSQLPYSLWVDSGSIITYSYTSVVPSSYSNKQFRLVSVTGPASPITVTGPTTVTGNYAIQYLVTFTQIGLDPTATGTVVTVNSIPKTYGQLPYTLWVDNGSSVTYTYSSPVSSNVTGKRFRLNSVSGPLSPFTVTCTATVTGNYVTQYSITFGVTGLGADSQGTIVTVNETAKTYSELPYAFWVDSGSTVTYSYTSTIPSSTAGMRYRLANVTGPPSPVTMTAPTTVTGNYVVQYQITFAQNGLDATATGTVVTVNGNPKTYANLPYVDWFDNGNIITYAYSNVSSSTLGKRFILANVSGPSSPVTVSSSVTVTGNYKTQYKVTFDQSGVGTDFTSTVVNVDSATYNRNSLPTEFWWDKNSNHSFEFMTPLVVNVTSQYVWNSTSGLTSLRNGTLTITTSGSVIGNYLVQNWITFDQVGVDPDFSATVVTIDGVSYGVNNLPKPFYWQVGTVHNFSFQSPLVVTANAKRYVWTSTTGLSSDQNGNITVSNYGSIVGHYKTQYYLNLASNPPNLNTPIGAGWYDAGAYVSISAEQFQPGGSRWRFDSWTTNDMSEIADPYSSSTTVLMDKGKTVTVNYVHQYLIIFKQSGLTSDASGTAVTINGTHLNYSNLSYSMWIDAGSIVNYSYESTVTSTVLSKRYSLTGVTGPSSPMTVTADENVTGNYKTQYYLTVTSPYGTTSGTGWYDSGTTAYAGLDAGIFDHGNGTRRVFTNWNGDATGTGYAQSDPMWMNAAKTALAVWKTQYNVTFTHSGLDSSATGTVVTVNSNLVTYGQLPYVLWVDSGSSVTYSYNSAVTSSAAGKQFLLIGVSGSSSPIDVSSPATLTGNYKTQFKVTFGQIGVLSDFTGTIVTVDGTDYTYNTLPHDFWWDNGSDHTFSFVSPLIVNISRQYVWSSTTGLTTLQNGTLTVTSTGGVTGNYVAQIKYQITFDQTGIDTDYNDVVVVVDGINLSRSQLSYSFWWDAGSSHSFAFQSPLLVIPNAKRYVWNSTSGLSSSQSGTINVTASGSIVGNYKTQYCLTLGTNPPGVASIPGSGWYYAGTSVTISADAFVPIDSGSRYRFDGWTTVNMSEIADPSRSPTQVIMDEGKTVTANYAVQYKVTFNQTGVSNDFGGAIVTVDGTNFTYGLLPHDFWWDNNSQHLFTFQSPLVVAANNKQYVWVNTTGLSTVRSGILTVSTFGNVTGNYKTQYWLTVSSDHDTPTPASGWYDAGTSISASVTTPWAGSTGSHFVCTGWTGTGSVPPSGTGSSTTFTINQASSLMWNWKTQYLLTVLTNPTGLTPQPARNPLGETGPANGWWYDASTSVTLTAQSVTGYNLKNWVVDNVSQGNGVNPITVIMNAPHTSTATYEQKPQLSVDINPYSNTIYLGQTAHFTSTVSGGIEPYSYQWYVNSLTVTGANSPTWAFTPNATGVYYVYLRVTDFLGSTAQSPIARITVITVPVGGYSFSVATQYPTLQIAVYAMLLTLFGAGLSLRKRKRK
jgi:hypothetical protein